MTHWQQLDAKQAEIKAYFAGISDETALKLKDDAARHAAFESEGAREMFKSLPITHGWVRKVIFEHVDGDGQASPPAPKARQLATVGAHQDLEFGSDGEPL